MVTRNSSGTRRVPAHIEALNALATAGGLRVTSEATNEDSGRRLLITWSGAQSQFYSLGLMPPHWRFPMIRQKSISLFYDHRDDPVSLTGEIEVSGDHFTMILSHLCPLSIQQNGAVEILDYDAMTAFHGSQDALVAQGFCKPCWFPKTERHGSKRGDGNRRTGQQRKWASHRQPDERFLVLVESDRCVQQQREEYERENSREERAAAANKAATEHHAQRTGRSSRVAGILDRWLQENQEPQTETRPGVHFTGSQEEYREAARRYVMDFGMWFDGFIAGQPERVAIPPFRFEADARKNIRGMFYPVLKMLSTSRIEENTEALATVARFADEAVRAASAAPGRARKDGRK